MSSAGAPTNIYIQGLDSFSQLSCQVGLLKEENISLQNQLKQARGSSQNIFLHRKKIFLKGDEKKKLLCIACPHRRQ